jgi:hypothetical protein
MPAIFLTVLYLGLQALQSISLVEFGATDVIADVFAVGAALATEPARVS